MKTLLAKIYFFNLVCDLTCNTFLKMVCPYELQFYLYLKFDGTIFKCSID